MQEIEVKELIVLIFVCAAIYQLYAVTSLTRIWLRCILSGAPIAFPVLVAMKLRRTNVERVTGGYIRLLKAGIIADLMVVEADYIKDPRRFESGLDELILEYDEIKKTGGSLSYPRE